jgi:adenylate kinase family enzyme
MKRCLIVKIHIIGGSGSGKTTISQRLADKYNLPLLELDEIYWNDGNYNIKRPKYERNRLLNSFLKNDRWIIEGVYYKWLDDSFNDSDYIFILDVNRHLRNYRICKRFFVRKFNKTHKSESISSLIELILWNNKFDKKNMLKIKEKLNINFSNKTFIIRSYDDIESIIEN